MRDHEPPLYLGKVDATANRVLTQKYEIRGFPTLKFFRNGHVSDYDYGRTKEDIIDFMKEKSGPISVTYDNVKDLKNAISSSPLLLVGYFKDTESSDFSSWYDDVSTFDSLSAVHITDPSIAEEMKASMPSILLYRSLDDFLVFDGKPGELKKWVYLHSLPPVVPFKQQYSKLLFSPEHGVTLQLIVFSSQKTLDDKGEVLRAIAETFFGKLFVVSIPSEDFRLLDFFGIDPNSLPVLLLADFSKDPMTKYRFEGDFTQDAIADFINRFFAGSLKVYLKSEDPVQQNGVVFRLVGKTFDEVAYDPEKNVFVKFYAPWCGHCKALAPVYEELANAYEDDQSVVIAEIDATRNEVDGVNIRGFPTLIFYKAGGDGKESVVYEGKRTLEAMKEFVEKHRVFVTEDDEEL